MPLIGAVLYRTFGVADHFDARRLTGSSSGLPAWPPWSASTSHTANVLGIVEVVFVALCYATGPLVISRKLADLPGSVSSPRGWW